MAAKTSRGLTYISIALLFETQQWVNTRAIPLLATLTLLLDEKLRKEAMISSAEVRRLCETAVCLNFKCIWLHWQRRAHSFIRNLNFASAYFPSVLCVLFPLVRSWCCLAFSIPEITSTQSLSSDWFFILCVSGKHRIHRPLNQVWRGQRWAEKWMNSFTFHTSLPPPASVELSLKRAPFPTLLWTAGSRLLELYWCAASLVNMLRWL